ncbi:MAG TPA: NADH-quinone oxidoreductase subunit NuoK [Coriobacteriia bacterium]
MSASPITLLCTVLFGLGVYGTLARRDLVAVLACVEVMLGAASVQLVAFAHAAKVIGSGQAFALVLLVLAAAEACVGLGLVLATVKRAGTQRVDELTEVRG